VRLADGREVVREEAHRDDRRFPAACRVLLASGDGDDAMLGAWLLGTAPAAHRSAAEGLLGEALESADPRAAFQAALALEEVGAPTALPSLARAARSGATPEVRLAAEQAMAGIERRREAAASLGGAPGAGTDGVSGEARADSPRDTARGGEAPGLGDPPGEALRLPRSFRRGVCWWWSEAGRDQGASSFRRLASLGVTWVSIHTWDPLQQGRHDPEFAEARRRGPREDLAAVVANAHAAGLAVMLKPHLEMRGYDPTPEERRVLRGGDAAARRALVAEIRARAVDLPGDHNRIEMKTEAHWRRWFRNYEAWILPYAEAAREAGVDAFCVGRELDTTVIRREGDWRRLVSRVRGAFPGPLTYSANFDTWHRVALWDALDAIGISAYFPLSQRPVPSVEELQAGWAAALAPLEEASRRWGRPVLLTEAGFASTAGAARAPWREDGPPADVWLQARCYEATLRAVAERPWLEGVFFWLWERPAEPPFRDPSHAIPGKPAAYVMARWFRGGLRPEAAPAAPGSRERRGTPGG